MKSAIVAALLLASGCEARQRVGRRLLEEEEKQRCEAEIKVLDEMMIPFAASRTTYGFTLAVYDKAGAVNDFVSSDILRSGQWEGSQSSRAFEFAAATMARAPAAWKACEAGTDCHESVAVDIGANVGWWTFNAAVKGWRAVAVEGAPPNVALLKLSMCLNPSLAPLISINHALLGDHEGACAMAMPTINIGDGTVHCQLYGKDVDWSPTDLKALEDSPQRYKIQKAYRVPVTRLQTILDRVWSEDKKLPHHVTFTKMDIEGSEYRALNGTTSWAQPGRLPIIYSEIWKDIVGGPDNFLKSLHTLGYTVMSFFYYFFV